MQEYSVDIVSEWIAGNGKHPIVVNLVNLYVQQQLPLPTRHIAILLSIVMAKDLNALMDCFHSTIAYGGAEPFHSWDDAKDIYTKRRVEQLFEYMTFTCWLRIDVTRDMLLLAVMEHGKWGWSLPWGGLQLFILKGDGVSSVWNRDDDEGWFLGGSSGRTMKGIACVA